MQLNLRQEHRNHPGTKVACCHVWAALEFKVIHHLFVLFVVNDDLTFVVPPLVLTKLAPIADVVSTPNSDCLVTDTAVLRKPNQVT